MEKIPDSLIVDFHHADHDLEGLVFVVGRFYLFEYLVAYDRNDSLIGPIAYHRITLAGARLAVCKKATVVAFPELIEKYQALTRISEPH